MIVSILLFLAGLIVLVKSSSVLVRHGTWIARYLGVSTFVIGILVAGIGTSIPEFAVMVTSNLLGEAELGLGSIIGSNTFNLLFVLGLCALMSPIYFKRDWITRDMVWNILATLAVGVVAVGGGISRLDGLVLTALLVAWVIAVARSPHHDGEEGTGRHAVAISFLLIVAGLVGVLVGAHFVVDGAALVAREVGVSEALIGILVLGIGTSLPEMVVSVTAVVKRQYGMVIGSLIGSNVFDFLGVFGITALIKPIAFQSTLLIDVFFILLASLVVVGFVYRDKERRLSRFAGMWLMLLFAVYLSFVFVRG